ncbi:UNVERIFIED_CONTAM: Common plant regulatory factor 1 [Sesamum latifolium]|uniref:Common plant regulatory factor 1 n=1 Tax=Sesamum latifolium TaxID=2727402 RepID=A0AAW2YGR3_9LAMI
MTYCVVHAFHLAEHLPPQLRVTQWKIKGVPRRIMGNSEEAKPSKSEKSSPPAMDQNSVHVYPDWATMQAFYGPRLAVPPYMNSAVASPHAPPPYMWGPPQSMIPPYGAPYAAFYAHGGVYAHPGVPLAGTSLSMETPVKSSGNTDGGFVKKLKEIDGLAISIGNGNGSSAEHGTERRTSDSYDTDDSSDGSNGDTAGAGQSGKKRSRQGSPSRGDGKVEKKNSIVPALEVGRASEKMIDAIPHTNAPVKAMENMNTALELKDPSLTNERELKRERRKQSNRESARRSRLRKQEKLKDAQLGQADEISLHKIDDLRLKKPVGTVNLLARVNNSDSTDRRNEEGESYENRSPGAKLHQLLDSSPRTDAVAAG